MAGKAVRTILPGGAMLHDAERLGAAADPAWLDAAHWQARGPLPRPAGGRGGALRVDTPAGPAILRPYRRGGFIARFNHDRYAWQGEDATRPFREYALLQVMRERGLPVPEPLAAAYRRSGLWYRGALLTGEIADATTLAQRLVDAPSAIDWALVGRTVARFHAAGFPHPDLNAHNVLFAGGHCHLVDFDRGAAAAPDAGWIDANLARLRRSLDKLGAPARVAGFEATHWPALCAAHAAAMSR
jgi:3-deoxy-D-manno-octulosonic acid kinase